MVYLTSFTLHAVEEEEEKWNVSFQTQKVSEGNKNTKKVKLSVGSVRKNVFLKVGDVHACSISGAAKWLWCGHFGGGTRGHKLP